MLGFLYALLARLFFFTGAVEDGSSYPKPLSREEEEECLTRARAGDAAAKEKLIRHNMRLVAHIAKKYSGAAETDDMISVGAIGLIKAINTFEPGRGTRLATYTARCIENEILMLIRAGKKHRGTVSLSDPVGTDKDGNELPIMDLLSAVKKLLCERETEVICMRYALNGGTPLAQREVARALGISRSYVSRIEKKALAKLKAGLKREDFLE